MHVHTIVGGRSIGSNSDPEPSLPPRIDSGGKAKEHVARRAVAWHVAKRVEECEVRARGVHGMHEHEGNLYGTYTNTTEVAGEEGKELSEETDVEC